MTEKPIPLPQVVLEETCEHHELALTYRYDERSYRVSIVGKVGAATTVEIETGPHEDLLAAVVEAAQALDRMGVPPAPQDASERGE